MLNKTIDILYQAKQNKIDIVLEDGQLRLKLPKDKNVDKSIIEEIRNNKEAIIEFLKNNSRNTKSLSKVTRADRESILRIPLSFNQERLLFIDRLEGSVQYHMPTILSLKGKLNKRALELALTSIVDRHEILRTVFIEEDGEGFQFIKENKEWALSEVNGGAYKNDHAALQVFIDSLIRQPFDLSNDYLMRAHLINLDTDDHVLVMVIHHIATDGWSISVLVKEVTELYSAFDEGRLSKLAPLQVQYADYAVWQRQFLAEEVLQKKLAYWKHKLDGATTLLQLPLDFQRPPVQSSKGASLSFTIDEILLAQLQDLSQQQGATLFMTLLAIFKVMLFRYSGQQDICVGTPIAGRQQQEIEGLIGFFVNTLVLRTEVSNEFSFTRLLQQVKATTMEAYENQELPFEKVVEVVVKERDLSKSPLFQVMFMLQNTPDLPTLRLGDLQLTRVQSAHNTSKYDLTFNLVQTIDGLQATVEYCTDLFSGQTINRMMGHFKELVNAVVREPYQRVGLLPMLGYEEQQQLLVEFNHTRMVYPNDQTIISLFEEQSSKTPADVAVVFEQKQLTYQELNERSNQLAHYLQTKGIKKETLVPICIERGFGMIVGLLAILKAGATYVPVDPGYPEDRISYMLEDSGAAIIISSSESRSKMSGQSGFDIIEIDGDWELISKQPSSNLQITIDPKQLAYVIYTSGSTGKPKGVMIEHTSVINLLVSIAREVGFKPKSASLSVTTFSFDICYLELYMPLILGGKLIIVPAEVSTNGFRLSQEINKFLPTHVQGTPSTWQLLLDAGWQNEEHIKMLVGGEALKEDLKSVLTKWGDVWNVYGPTETTIWSTIKKLENTQRVLIGKPIGNTNVQIVNAEGQLVPIGVAGEIMIGGVGLARGYYNRPALTAEKFVNERFDKEPGLKMYRTGDLGKWLPDGNIECLGRIDEQVKIRGYRIELGEIETVLQQTNLVRQCVVLAKEDKSGNKRLVGYLVSEIAFDKPAIISILKNKLPEYMIPTLWVEMETLPLTPNGKINKKALPDPDASGLVANEYVAPRNNLEEKLVRIWQNLLHVERVGVLDNFFELGGHSLLVMRLVSVIRKELEVEIEIKSLFAHSSVAALAEYIGTRSNVSLLPAIEIQQRPQHIPLSFSQERLWFIDRFEGSTQYHIPAVLRLKGKVDQQALQYSLQTIFDRHEVLRTIFLEHEDEVYQHIKTNDKFELSIVDGKAYRDNNEGLHAFIKGLISAPFNLAKDQMFRAHLVSIDEQEHILVVNVHHIASDGWSMSIMVRELAALYSSSRDQQPLLLPPLPIQYADFAIWQRNFLQGEVLDAKINYWKEKLMGVAPLQLPSDYTRPAVQSTRGAVMSFTIDKELSNKLHHLNQLQGTTLFMTLLTAFKILLHRYSGQQDICVGSPVANRGQQEAEGLIGFFVNMLALRSEVQSNASFIELLQQVKATTLEAYQHQDVPFEKVVEVVVRERDLGISPLFQVMFVLQNLPEIDELRFDEVELQAEHFENNTSKFDLTFNMKEVANSLQGSVEYCTDLYRSETIHRMIGHFKQLLTAIVSDPQQRISQLTMLTKAEEQLLLVDFGDTFKDYPRNTNIINLFEEQVAVTPNSVALMFDGEQLSYQHLNNLSNQLAHYLRLKGVKEEVLVPVCIERGFGMIISILGVLKAGGAYVPIDPAYPADRIKYMLEDTGAAIVVTSKEGRRIMPVIENVDVIDIDGDEAIIAAQPVNNLATSIDRNHLAYVIYTSGSTGKPKGVMIEHSNVYSFICWCREEFSSDHFEIVYATTSICFDLSIFEIFYPLTIGKPVRILDHGLSIGKYLAHDSFVLINTVPVIIENLIKEETDLTNVSVINMAGEPIPYHVQQSLDTERIQVRNLYGPTEDTTYSTMYTLHRNAPILIGRPLSNKHVRILNQEGAMVPVGITGEITIGGSGLARGYLNRPELTAEKFIKDPFDTGALLYKTGDVGRWLTDGNIEYQGRMDEQVKIRGYRIELGEIESMLLQSGLVNQAAVLAPANNEGIRMLVGYIVAGTELDKEKIMQYLRGKLPEFMVPAIWMQLEAMPLTANGKINRKALPPIDNIKPANKEYAEPANHIERKLATIWQGLLKIDKVSVDDNFFELGGHSLLAMRVISSVKKQLGVELTIKDLFNQATISSLANRIQNHNEAPVRPSIEVQVRPEQIPLSFSQERLWFIDNLEGSQQYHLPVVLRLKGNLDEKALQYSLQAIVDRHEVLRTTFIEEDGKVYQSIQPKGNWTMMIEDGLKYKKDVGSLKAHIEMLVKTPFDLSKEHPVRASLIKPGDQEYILVVTTHHIASDAWSVSIIVKEVVELYDSFIGGRAAVLVDLPLQYADYAIWQRNYLQGSTLAAKMDYWKNKLEDVMPLQLPTDYSRPKVRSTQGASARIWINEVLSAQLNQLAQQNSASLFMVLLATFKILLNRYSGQQDICVGASIANRPQQELEGLIGFFVNTVALRTEVVETASFMELLKSVKATTLEAYEHQEVPFDQVVEEIVKDRDPSRTPIFQVLMVLLNTPEPSKLGFGEVELSNEPFDMQVSKFDISFHIAHSIDGLSIAIMYNRDLFMDETIIRMGGHFKELLNSVVKEPGESIELLQMLTEAEEQQLLIEFT